MVPEIVLIAAFAANAVDPTQGSAPTFWQTIIASSLGGLITGGIAIIGVTLTNRSSDKRFADQQAFDATQKKIERTLDLRRGVYLDVSESLARFGAAIGGLANPENKIDDLGQAYAGFNASTSKLLLICDPDTATSALELVAIYSRVWMRLVVARMPLSGMHAEIHVSQQLVEARNAELSRILAKMRDHNENIAADPAQFALLSQSYNSEMGSLQSLLDKMEPLREKYSAEMAKFLAAVTKEGDAIRELHPLFLERLRKDLNAEPLPAEFAAKAAIAQDEIVSEIHAGFANVIKKTDETNLDDRIP